MQKAGTSRLDNTLSEAATMKPLASVFVYGGCCLFFLCRRSPCWRGCVWCFFSFQIKLCMQLPCFLNHWNGSSVKKVPFTLSLPF